MCGRFAREINSKVAIPSQEIIVATKFAPIPLRTSRESVLKALRESLERIGADKCDLYQLHWPSFFFDSSYWDGLADAYDAGAPPESMLGCFLARKKALSENRALPLSIRPREHESTPGERSILPELPSTRGILERGG